jgi:hypothetical protein
LYFASLTYIHASIMLFPVLSTTHDHTRRSPRGQAGRCQSWAMEKHRSHSIHLQDVIIPEVCSSSSISVTGLQALAFKYYLLIYLFSSHSCYLCAQSLLHLVNKSTRICMFFNSNSVGKCIRDYNSYLFPSGYNDTHYTINVYYVYCSYDVTIITFCSRIQNIFFV